MESQVSTVLKIQRLRTRGEVVMPKKKKKQPTKSKKPRAKRELEGYYIDDKGLRILYKKKDGGLSI